MCRANALLVLTWLPAAACHAGGVAEGPACRDALARLQAQEERVLASPASGPRSPPAALLALRRQAAADCLGRREDETPPAGRGAEGPLSVPHPVPLPVPQSVPPVLMGPPALRPPLPASGLPALPTRPPPATGPSVITSCDLTGCWASDGTRLTRSGALLVGPRGPCNLNGTFLLCP